MRYALVVVLLALGSSSQALAPLPQAAPPPTPKVAFLAATDPRGALLRWNFTGAPYPEGGFLVFRRDPGAKDPIRITPQPVRRVTPAEATTLLGRAIKPHVPKPGVVPPEVQRARDASIALRAETDLAFAKAYGLYTEDRTTRGGPQVSYELRALDAQGKETLWGVSNHITPGQAATLPPPTLHAPKLVADGVLLSWTPANPEARVSSFHILRDGQRLTQQARVVTKDPDDSAPAQGTYIDRGLKAGETHTYAVVALDGFGRESAPVATAPLTWRDTTPPSRPVPMDMESTLTGVRLRWPRPGDDDLAGYHVYRSTGGAAPARLTAKPLAVTTLTYEDSPPPGVEVIYAVTSVDTSGNESPLQRRVANDVGKIVERMHGGAPYRLVDRTPPAVPAGLAAKLENGSAVLTWTANAEKDLKSYAVERATKAAGPWKRVADTAALRHSELLAVPAFGGEWFYRLSAADADGNRSEACDPVSLKAQGILPPRAPAAPGNNVRAGGVRTIPANARITVNREAKTIDYEGYSIKMDAVMPAGGTATGKLRVPWFDADIRVAVVFENDAVKSVDVAVPTQTFTHPPLGLYVTVTDIEFFATQAGRFLTLTGSLTVGQPSKSTFTDIPFDGFVVRSSGVIGSPIPVHDRSFKVGFFDFDIDNIHFPGDGVQKYLEIDARVSLGDDLAGCKTKVRLRANGGLECDPLTIDFEKVGIGVTGSAKLKDDGGTFVGDIKLAVLGLSLDGHVEIGMVGQKVYLGAYIEAEIPGGIPLGASGLVVYKFGGGIGLNMTAVLNGEKVTFNRQQNAWAFLARVGVRTIDGHILDGTFTFKIQSGPQIELHGNAKLLEAVTADATIRMGSDGFLCSAHVHGGFGKIADGSGMVELYFGRGTNNWHIFLGTEEDPMRGQVLGLLHASFYFQVQPVGGGVEIKCGISQEFDTGRCEAWIFYGRAYLGFYTKFSVSTDLTINAEFYARGGVEAGACVEGWGCLDFSLDCRAHLKIHVSKTGVNIHGSFRVGADLPLLGYESVSMSF